MEEKIVETGDHVSLKLFLKYKNDEGEECEIVNLYAAHESPLHSFIPDDRLIPAVNDVLLGMRIGETRKIEASPERGYGVYDKIRVRKVPFESVKKDGVLPQIGQVIAEKYMNKEIYFTVTELDETEKIAILDGNHVFAGKEITGEITVINIEKN